MSSWLDCEIVSVEESGIKEVQIAKCPYCQKYLTTPYMYYFTEFPFCPSCGKRIVKNEIHCMYSPEEVAESFIESVSAVEDQLDGSEVRETEDCERMTIDDAVRCNEQLRLFMIAEDAGNDTNRFLEESYTALDMSIQALRNMELLTDRPCLVCKNHTDTGCKAWDCPFDSVVVPETEYEYAIFDDTDSIRSQHMDSLDDARELLEKFKDYGNKKFYIKKRPIVKWENFE